MYVSELNSAYKSLVGLLHRRTPPWRPARRWWNGIKNERKEIIVIAWTGFSWLWIWLSY